MVNEHNARLLKSQGIHQIAHKSEKQEDSLLLTQSTKGQGRQVYIDKKITNNRRRAQNVDIWEGRYMYEYKTS
jgi:hypothetical protein